MKLIFKESQKFRQWWLWLFLIGSSIIPIAMYYKQIILGEPIGSKPMKDTGLYVMILVFILLLVIFWFLELRTHITNETITMKYFPFVNRKITWNDIESAEVIDYGFVGGWGIRFPTEYGVVYNAQGSKGLAIKLKTGKKILIGTQNEKELAKVVNQCLK